jgi:hypothetical protein
MERSKVARVGLGIIFSLSYAGLFIALWYSSNSQLYLPAGIRVAGLLFLPRRMWPYLMLGDAAALLFLRAPKAEQYSTEWAFLSPFLLLPIISVAVHYARRLLPDIVARQKFAPAIMLVTAVWTGVANASLNYFLSGPVQDNTLELFIRFAIGQYLGMLTIALPIMLWRARGEPMLRPQNLGRDFLIAALTLATAYAAVQVADVHVLKQGLLMLMLFPTVALTMKHGWRGAVLGIAAANFAIRLTLPETGLIGAHDADAFVAQQVLAVIGTALYILGCRISITYDRAARLGMAEKRAIALAQSNEATIERDLRDRARSLAISQMTIHSGYQELIEQMKSDGYYSLAMKLTSQGVVNTQMLLDNASAVYPLGIDTEGLYWVLESLSFANACQTEVHSHLTGPVHALPIATQLLAYRCICNAIDLLSGAHAHKIHARVWRLAGACGIVVSVQGLRLDGAYSVDLTGAGTQLENRIETHGGLCKRRRSRITFALFDCSAAKTGQGVATASIHQIGPLMSAATRTMKSAER